VVYIPQSGSIEPKFDQQNFHSVITVSCTYCISQQLRVSSLSVA
jgi:hypothetical protein